ncbi:MAG: lipid II flippase Amj family protein [Desulfotomaculaceae bacterium]|nr:lipid II flippase Amj family protein [Desulfotomaculaceae bacterium]
MERLLAVAALTAIIHLINTLIYAVRISGVRTQRLATAFSLFNVIFLLASTANSIQGFLLASIVEKAIKLAQTQAGISVLEQLVPHPAYQAQLSILDHNIRLIIAAATLGTLIGAALIPPFVNIFTRAIYLFEETGSVPRLLGRVIFSPRRILGLTKEMRLPGKKTFKLAMVRRLAIPKTFLILNFFVTGIYTTGVLSALFAGALFPDFRAAAATLSAVVNGIATILAATVVDPTAAAITDQALRGERSEDDVKQMALYLAITRLLGTGFAQLIFVPAAYFIKYMASLLA